jgi:hypothetical protein
MYRVGAIPSLGMVNLFEDAISKKRLSQPTERPPEGEQLADASRRQGLGQ